MSPCLVGELLVDVSTVQYFYSWLNDMGPLVAGQLQSATHGRRKRALFYNSTEQANKWQTTIPYIYNFSDSSILLGSFIV